MQQPTDRSPRARRILAGLGAAVLVLGLAACNPHLNKMGNQVDPKAMVQIKPGVTTKEQVQDLIGSPSSIAAFSPNTWYYISKKTERWAFLPPDVLEQQVVQIDFDDKGRVKAIHKYGEKDTHDVEMVARTTPTRGQQYTMFDQIWYTLLHQFGGGGGNANLRDPFNR